MALHYLNSRTYTKCSALKIHPTSTYGWQESKTNKNFCLFEPTAVAEYNDYLNKEY